jgi:hypothetical protein
MGFGRKVGSNYCEKGGVTHTEIAHCLDEGLAYWAIFVADEKVYVGYFIPFSNEGFPYFEGWAGGYIGGCEFIYRRSYCFAYRVESPLFNEGFKEFALVLCYSSRVLTSPLSSLKVNHFKTNTLIFNISQDM